MRVKQGGRGRRRGAGFWSNLKDKFVDLHVSGAGPTTRAFAEAEGVPYATLNTHCVQAKWFEEIERHKTRLTALSTKRAEDAHMQVVKRLNFDEVELRTRLAQEGQLLSTLARAAVGRYLARATQVTKDKSGADVPPDIALLDAISMSDAAFIMKTGQELQRKAYGLPEKYAEIDVNHTVSPAEQRFERQVKSRAEVIATLTDISKIIEGEVTGRETERD